MEPDYDLVIVAEPKHAAQIRWSLQYTTFEPKRIYIISDEAPIMENLLIDINNIPTFFVSSSRFPFTLAQIKNICKNGVTSQDYRSQLIKMYCSEVLEPLSDYYWVVDPEIFLGSKVPLFNNIGKPYIGYSHGCYVPFFTHIKKVSPVLRKQLKVSAVFPLLMVNKEYITKMITELTDKENKRQFWKVFLEATDPLSSSVNASWQELYVNFIYQYYNYQFQIIQIPIISSSLHKITPTSPMSLCEPVSCSYQLGPSYFSRFFPLISYPQSSKVITPYLTYLKQMRLTLPQQRITWVDVGCGKLSNVYKYLPWDVQRDRYVGVDLQTDIQEINKSVHNTLSYAVLDATQDILPSGNICIVREVFQHLCFAHINLILHQLRYFKLVIITDKQPEHRVCKIKENVDKATDTTLRSKGLWLELPPFNLNIHVGLEVPVDNNTSVMRTVLWRP